MSQCEAIQYFLLNNSTAYNVSAVDFQSIFEEYCNGTDWNELNPKVTSMAAVTMTVVYAALLTSGVAGNIFTCAVIARNRYMHTATNCYLFSLAVSDLLLLITGIPHEIHMLWIPQPPYTLGEIACVFRGFTAETSAYASVLTITSFTIERYLAICHPLKTHAISSPSRAVKFAAVVWFASAASALLVALQFGLIYQHTEKGEIIPESSVCTLKRHFKPTFLLSALIFFCIPLALIFILYVKIGLKLKKPTLMGKWKDNKESTNKHHDKSNRKGIIKMLVAVVVCFFLCWSPFHAQRLMATYVRTPTPFLDNIFYLLHQVSGTSYYLSATLDPILYHLMSRRFRKAFHDTFCCDRSGDSRGALGGTTDCSTSKVDRSAAIPLQSLKT